MKIAIVCPSARPQQVESFLVSWMPLARNHNAEIYIVYDEPAGFRVVRHFTNNATEKRHLDARFKPLIFTQTESVVEHHRMSDAFDALAQEAAGIREHEQVTKLSAPMEGGGQFGVLRITPFKLLAGLRKETCQVDEAGQGVGKMITMLVVCIVAVIAALFVGFWIGRNT